MAFRRTTPGNHNFRTLRDEDFRRTVSDAARCTGDDCDLVVETPHIVSPFVFMAGI
jgi:hypothetical protein